MATTRSSGTDRELADERTVRMFLERAAPVILESRSLDGPRFETVLALSDEMGLTREQLSCELRFLELRGVISSVPWSRLDAPDSGPAVPTTGPPPLPTPGAPATAAPGKTPERRPTAPTASVSTPSPAARTEPATPPPPPPPPPPSPSVSIATPTVSKETEARLRELIAQHVARAGGWTPQVRLQVETEAKLLGLTPEQVMAAIAAPTPAPTPTSAMTPALAPTPSPAPAPGPSFKAAPPTGEQAATLPAQPSPAESFRRWVKQKLAGYPSAVLATDDEQGLIGVGSHRYRLADVLATHIVRDIVTDMEMRLERDLEGASCHSTVGGTSQMSSDDQKLSDFFEQVAPILSQHRGINAQSRVMLNAIAEQLGMTEEELDRAIRALSRSIASSDENDPRQRERRESFRSYLRRAMAQLPNGIVTFRTHQRLIEAGEHFHGVAPQWIKPTINEVASETGARFISREQAVEHVTALIADVLDNVVTVGNETRVRVYAEGTRWGLDPMEVESLLREHTELTRRQVAADKQLTRWILISTAGTTALAVGGIVWLLFLRPSLHKPSEPGVIRETAHVEQERDERKPVKSVESMPAWWNEETRLAAVNVRVAHGDLKAPLEQIQTIDVGQRRSAYQQIISWYLAHLGDTRSQRDMRELLAKCFAADPANEAAQIIPEQLLQPARTLETTPPADPEAVSAAFWGCRTAAALYREPGLPPERDAELTRLFQSALGHALDRSLDADTQEKSVVAALARRGYATLTRAATTNPRTIGPLYRALASETRDSLDDATLYRLDAELLATLLPALDDRWEDFRDILRRTTRSDDSFVVLKMLEVFRNITDERLRNFLAGYFYTRVGAEPGTLTEGELIDAVRRAVGVAAREENVERWKTLAQRSTELVATTPAADADPLVVVQELLDRAYLTTLACALAQGEDGLTRFEELESAGPTRLSAPAASLAAEDKTPFVSPYPVSTGTVVQQHIERLSGARLPRERITLLQIIANSADTVPDLDPVAGQKLAEYLLQAKPDEEEHRRVVVLTPRLKSWNSLRLGLADQLMSETGRVLQQQEVLRAALGEEVTLNNPEDRQRIRARLLRSVSQSLHPAPVVVDQPLQTLDTAQQALQELYIAQAQVLRVPAETYATRTSPSMVLQALTTHVAGLIDGSKVSPAEKLLLASLPNQLTAIDFLADEDVQRTALLQQLWLRVFGAWLSQQLPAKTLAIRGIVDETQASAGAEKRVWEQMRDLEQGLLRLWMLYQPSDDTTPAPEVKA